MIRNQLCRYLEEAHDKLRLAHRVFNIQTFHLSLSDHVRSFDAFESSFSRRFHQSVRGTGKFEMRVDAHIDLRGITLSPTGTRSNDLVLRQSGFDD